MNSERLLTLDNWNEAIRKLLNDYAIYAPLSKWGNTDYESIITDNISDIIYNHPRPATPLKSFFLPAKENVSKKTNTKKIILLGVPGCDLKGLDLLDEIYLDNKYLDITYKSRRDNTIIIGTDCHHILNHCHCTTYGIMPFPDGQQDITLIKIDSQICLIPASEKGENLIKEIEESIPTGNPGNTFLNTIVEKRLKIGELLKNQNKNLPSYEQSIELVEASNGEIWNKHSQNCVSCGACALSCPTCTCFLLVDRPGFEKIRSMDACQFPGFERVAAGEDPLGKLKTRFKNRYLCKFSWKPSTYQSTACTGCGRCIDACIGNINKNEILIELNKKINV